MRESLDRLLLFSAGLLFIATSVSSGLFLGLLTCEGGFDTDWIYCRDIDECLESPCSQNQICKNTVGSFICSCKHGYTTSSCTDIDECQEGKVVIIKSFRTKKSLFMQHKLCLTISICGRT